MPSNDQFYISYGGEQVFQQPYRARDTQLYAFVLPLKSDRRDPSQALLDRVFNRPSNGRADFRLALPFVMVSFQRFGSLSATTLPDSAKGGFAYSEATVWLPVRDAKRPGLDLCYFVPYIFADNHFAIATGREVYGYPKALGQIEMPPTPRDELNFRLTTEAIAHFSSEAMAKPETLIEVRPIGAAKAPETTWQKWQHVAAHFAARLVEQAAQDTLEFVTHELFQPQVEMVFLKQFRDAASGEKACYQAIVEGAASVTDFAGGAPLGEFEVQLHALDSHPIGAELGLEEVSKGFGFFLEFSFDILPGRELETAP